MLKPGSCQICTSVQNCTKILMHQGIKLPKDTIARRVTFARSDNFAQVKFFY